MLGGKGKTVEADENYIGGKSNKNRKSAIAKYRRTARKRYSR